MVGRSWPREVPGLGVTILRGVKGGMGGSCGQGSSAARKQKVIQNIGFQNISRHFYKLILTFLMSFF